MIHTDAIIVALLPAGVFCGLWLSAVRKFRWANGEWLKEADGVHSYWYVRAQTAEDRLAEIKRSRHEAAKKARAAQLAQQAALVASTTEQIRKEIGR